jgi:hypothetical protein
MWFSGIHFRKSSGNNSGVSRSMLTNLAPMQEFYHFPRLLVDPVDEAQQAASSLLRFAFKSSANRRSGDFLPCKLRKDAG